MKKWRDGSASVSNHADHVNGMVLQNSSAVVVMPMGQPTGVSDASPSGNAALPDDDNVAVFNTEHILSEDDYRTDDDEDDMVEGNVLGAEWADTYRSFSDHQKWFLKSGRAVEDVLYKQGVNSPRDSAISSLLRSWIVAVDNSTMKSWFSTAEWDEIISSVPRLPQPDTTFVQSLVRFHAVTTVEDLRTVLFSTTSIPPEKTYERNLHIDSFWADTVIRSFYILFEALDQPLCQRHLERWYTSRIWSPIIDQCFQSLPHMTLERDEAVCRATSARKNRNRTETKTRAKTGNRHDGILRTIEDDSVEFFCMEVSPTFQGGMTSTKWLIDHGKLVKTLRDMLGRLVTRKPQSTGTLQVVAAIAAGLTLRFYRLIHHRGSVCLWQPEEPNRVPYTVGKLRDLLFLLNKVVQIKAVINESVQAVYGEGGASSPTQFYRDLLSSGGPPATEEPDHLPWPAETP